MNTPTESIDQFSTSKSTRSTAKRDAATREHDDSGRSYNLERVADALHFMDNVQPLAGCDFTDDEEFHAGRSILLRLLEQEVR